MNNLPLADEMTAPGAANPIDWPAALAQHGGWMRKVLGCRVSDRHAVDDLMQEIALAVLQQPARPTQPQKVAPWLYRLAVRKAISFHRRSGRQRNLLQRWMDRGAADRPGEADPLHWLVSREQQQILRRSMQQMRPQDNEILVLKYSENWNYTQLAEHLGVSLHCVEYRLLRAKKRLRSLLNSMCGACP